MSAGYMGASVRDIVQAAGVPQGSFTNHFTSKEAFALEVLDLYYAESVEIVARSLKNADLAPLERIRAYIRENKQRITRDGVQNGCLYGNFSAEAVDHSEPIRLRLGEIFQEAENAVEHCLKVAVADGAAPAQLDTTETAAFFVSGAAGRNPARQRQAQTRLRSTSSNRSCSDPCCGANPERAYFSQASSRFFNEQTRISVPSAAFTVIVQSALSPIRSITT